MYNIWATVTWFRKLRISFKIKHLLLESSYFLSFFCFTKTGVPVNFYCAILYFHILAIINCNNEKRQVKEVFWFFFGNITYIHLNVRFIYETAISTFRGYNRMSANCNWTKSPTYSFSRFTWFPNQPQILLNLYFKIMTFGLSCELTCKTIYIYSVRIRITKMMTTKNSNIFNIL